jgi:hypothetical protein
MSPRKATSKKRAAKDNYDELLSGSEVLAENIQALNKQGVEHYTPVVADIIQSNCRDVKYIERTLDELLTFCGE